MKYVAILTILFTLVVGDLAGADQTLDFTLHKLESGKPGYTMLVVGGIQGDEPGGFNAASLLVTMYKINRGSVWVVPNLNFISIIKRSRGVHGDLNRKFASISGSDPEYEAIQKIKGIILDEDVDLILNLHDGSGFFRPNYVDKYHNPNRWGQCVIIDQERLKSQRFGNLKAFAERAVSGVNRHLIKASHAYRVKNTRTRDGNTEMAKTLTYFAVQHFKPAFGLEASKSFPTHKRAYYHIRAIESFMDIMGIEYERKIELSTSGIQKAINNNIQVALYDRKIFLDVRNARNQLNYVPLKKNSAIEFTPSNPLIAILSLGKKYRVYHGNRRVTHLHPQYFEYDSSIDAITLFVDGKEKTARFGDIVGVGDTFTVAHREGYRINVIGFHKPGLKNESGVPIRQRDIQKRHSIDKSGWIYRIEVYRNNRFTGMVLVDFNRKQDHINAGIRRHQANIRLAQLKNRTGSIATKDTRGN